ncbi:NUDIX hydrolase [Aurantimonas sp. DM33-3]|uniref:NUDIX hydrolase n=1 Tax=Aurantimonas sp. DM33-3 TaxID=2766955 RepID=UPI001652AFB2|nr:NUDIX hydrolase [Aurantimonas sp. DM33-3]MBC6716690.1 NUDIX hydrolase [Aurantimonas sp. DM33-3]
MMEVLRERLAERSMLRGSDPSGTQTGTIPYAVVGDQPVFLLITSRRTGRWIFPKGSLMEGLAPWESAAQEAFEEAGVEGHVEQAPLGTYRTLKRGLRQTKVLDVTLYPLRVEQQHDAWQEMRQRYRHWATFGETRRLLTEKPVVELTEKLYRRLTAS